MLLRRADSPAGRRNIRARIFASVRSNASCWSCWSFDSATLFTTRIECRYGKLELIVAQQMDRNSSCRHWRALSFCRLSSIRIPRRRARKPLKCTHPALQRTAANTRIRMHHQICIGVLIWPAWWRRHRRLTPQTVDEHQRSMGCDATAAISIQLDAGQMHASDGQSPAERINRSVGPMRPSTARDGSTRGQFGHATQRRLCHANMN